MSTRPQRTTEHVRVDLPDATVVPWNAETYAYRALVAHVRGPATGPLRLHVTRPAPNPVVPPVHEQRDAHVHDLRNERVAFLVGRMLLDLREDERVPALDDLLREPRY